jgi:hypothetical protein
VSASSWTCSMRMTKKTETIWGGVRATRLCIQKPPGLLPPTHGMVTNERHLRRFLDQHQASCHNGDHVDSTCDQNKEGKGI